MRLRFDSAILEWFSTWTREFDWDEGNLRKNEKHGITTHEIERIFESPIYVAGKILETDEEPRWLLLGETGTKEWTLIVTIRGRKLRVISCRRQRKKEVDFYENFKKEIKNFKDQSSSQPKS